MDVQIQVFFWSNKTAYRISFFDSRAALKTLRCGASIAVPLACWASALPSELHPRWGNWGANAISKLSSVNAIVEQSFLLHIVVKLALSMRVINPSVSDMPIACPFGWHASLVGTNGAVHVRGMSLVHLSVEQCFLRRLCEVNLGDSGHQSLSEQALYCFRCILLHIGRTYQCLFFWSNKIASCS